MILIWIVLILVKILLFVIIRLDSFEFMRVLNLISSIDILDCSLSNGLRRLVILKLVFLDEEGCYSRGYVFPLKCVVWVFWDLLGCCWKGFF